MAKTLKTMSLLTIFALLAVGLIACGGGGSVEGEANESDGDANGTGEEEVEVYEENGLPVDEEVTLKVGFADQGGGREWLDYAIETFTEKFPNVSFDVTASPDIRKITDTKIAAKDDDDMWDFFNGGVSGGITPLVEAGLLESVEDLWDREIYDEPGKLVKELALDGLYDSAQRFDGDAYHLPVIGSGYGLFFNKNMFEEHGWDQNPDTWDEFVDLLAEIKSEGVIPITFPGKVPSYLRYSFEQAKLFEIAEREGHLDESMHNHKTYSLPYFTSPESMEVWQRVYELGQAGYFPEGVAALDHIQSQMQIMQGQAAMVSTGSWVENEMKESTPDGFKWGFLSVPFIDEPGDTIWVRTSAGNGMNLWAGKPDLHKKWSKEFSVWLWNVDVQEKVASTGGFLPVRQDFLDDPEMADSLQDAIKEMFEYMDRNNTRTETTYKTETLSHPSVQKAGKTLEEAVTNIAQGKQDPKPILEEAEEFLKEAIEAEKD